MKIKIKVILTLLSLASLAIPTLAGPFLSTSRVAFRSKDKGLYLCAENGGAGGAINCNRTECGPWESFTLLNYSSQSGARSGDLVALKAGNPDQSFYVAKSKGGDMRSFPGSPWRFTISKVNGSAGDPIASGDLVTLQAGDGFYVCAENGGGGKVSWNRAEVGPWEQFIVQFR